MCAPDNYLPRVIPNGSPRRVPGAPGRFLLWDGFGETVQSLAMKNFICACGNKLYFDNSRCLRCERMLGFLPEQALLCAFEPVDTPAKAEPAKRSKATSPAAPLWQACPPGPAERRYRRCANYANHGVCNWMVPAEDPSPFCLSCRLNQVIPNLDAPRNHVLWKRIEAAKRRLLYTLYRLGLPVIGRDEDPDGGMAFAFLADVESADQEEFADNVSDQGQVLTGHLGGLITLNIAEADPSAREEMRERMNERYRTLLGHFRHESGHYYWGYLVQSEAVVAEFRRLFGDERRDYKTALETYYREGPPPDWQSHYISAYATSHPWEDWAETWAHYLHMIDSLDTAHDNGFAIDGWVVSDPLRWRQDRPSGAYDFTVDELLNDWSSLSLAMNDLNRSMGMPDAYPFAFTGGAVDKLRFVFSLIREASQGARETSA